MFSLLILIPMFTVMILNLPFRRQFRDLAFYACLVLFIIQMMWVILPFSAAFEPIFKFDLIIDDLSRIVLFCIGIVLFAATFVGSAVIKDEGHKFEFFNLLIIVLAGLNGIVMVKDVFSLYVFLEITAVSSFVLIALYRDMGGLEAAFKYLMLSAVATVLMLSSIALLLLFTGSTSFSAINAAIMTSGRSSVITFAMGLFICGLFIKGGFVPFHGWLPDAYSAAPSPVSVLLGGIVTKTVGVYALIRIVNLVFVFDSHIKLLLLFVGALSVVFGALAALGQYEIRRMLAYSSISQVGYIVLGLGCGTPLSIFGAIFHLLNHSIFKTLLFVNAAAVELQTGEKNMDRMSGLAERMPLTGITSLIGALSTAGIPPLSGFWSKLIIILSLWISGYHAYALIALIASVITLAYFLSMQRRVFWGRVGGEFSHVKEAGFGLAFPSIVLAALIIAIGLLFPFLVKFYVDPASLMGG
jgi:proton-translocating NADH-quinone oxidoreductase chain N